MTTERTTPLPDIEALSRNASLLVEEFQRAASRYMKPVATSDARSRAETARLTGRDLALRPEEDR